MPGTILDTVTVAEVSGALDTHVWASESWLPNGNRAKEAEESMQSRVRSVDAERRTKLLSLFSTL